MDLFELFDGGRGCRGNDSIILILLFFIIFGFGKCGNLFGNGNLLCCEKKCKSRHHSCCHKGHKSIKCCCNTGNGLGGLFTGNGLFVLAIFAILFLCDKKKERSCSTGEFDEEDIDDIEDVEDVEIED